MKYRMCFSIVSLFVLMGVARVWGQAVEIGIDNITANQAISGHVKGLTPAQMSGYKVLCYVHTDQWYIHPYAGQGDGMSWASIDAEGHWRIQTVQRQFKADMIAALVVSKGYSEPSTSSDIYGIPSFARVVKDLKATPDYGKV